MSYANYADVVDQLRYAGLMLDTVKRTHGGVIEGGLCVASTKAVRCDVSGERKRQAGAYWLHELRLNDGIWLAGSFWLDHGNTSYKLELRKTCAKCNADIPLKSKECPSCGHKKSKSREIPKEQLEAHKQRMIEARKQAESERREEIEKSSRWASAVWRACREVLPNEHDYLVRKKLSGTGVARIFESNEGIMLDGDKDELDDAYKYLATFHGALVVPACDQNGKVYGLQFILSREKHKETIARIGRDKCYWPAGMGVEGHYWLIGGTPTRICLVAEGYATAMSLHEATGHPVAVAFAANNLMPVAKALRKRYGKRVNLLMCADDDWVQRCDTKKGGCGKYTPVAEQHCKHCGHEHGKTNAGVDNAANAALSVGGSWIKPEFTTERPDDKKGPTDFNDLHCIDGIQLIRAQIEQKVATLGWVASPPASAAQLAPRAGQPPQGGRGNERKAAVSVMALDDAVERFVPLDDGTGKFLFDTWTNKIVNRDQMVALLVAGARWDDVKRHYRWVERGAYYVDQVGFDPAGGDTGIKLNTWRGWPMTPKQGKCDLLLELLHYLCSLEKNNEEIYNWLLCWMAYPLQNPGAKMSSAVIMHGPQGTGKSTIFQTLSRIYGDYATVLNQRGLEDKFNADWVDTKLFLLAEEVVTRAEMWHIKNELKELVTGDWVRVNGKFAGAYRQRNHINIAYLSNEGQPLPLENDDRRHCVVWTPPELGAEFYEEVQLELEDGGVEAFYHYLISLDLTGFHPKRRPPDTQAKRNLIDLSRPSEERFLLDWMAGDITFNDEDGPLPFGPAGTTDLYSAYLKWCRQQGEFRPRALNQFIGALSRRNGWSGQHRDRYASPEGSSTKKRQRMIEPSEVDIITHLKTGSEPDPRQKPGEHAITWTTRCFFNFRKALGGDQ